jgi:DNA-binding transcriptional MerR regulator
MATVTHDTSERRLTIGAVRERLREEFPDISISKIRYLEGQGLLAPRRTQSGYRLYTEDDVERLRTILRLQRDEFLPLRVIREELAAPGAKRRTKRRSADTMLTVPEPEVDLRTLCERSGADAAFVRELEDFKILEPRLEDGTRRYPERDVEVVAACARLARFGIEPRNLSRIRNGGSP